MSLKINRFPGMSESSMSSNGSTPAGAAPVGASYVVVSLDATLTAERVLAAAAGELTLADTGPNLAITVGLANAGPGVTSKGSATRAPVLTIDAKGRVTALSDALITPAASSITGGAALSKTDDTNVTLTLGGASATALLAAASLQLGWTGTLAAARLNANVVQAITNDTNVTGSIAAQNLTLGWTGRLGLARGGTNADLSATGGAGFVLKQSSAGAAITVAALLASDIPSSTAIAGDVTGTLAATTVGKINGVAYNADPLVQYALLAGRSGGQVLQGGTSATDTLDLSGTSNGSPTTARCRSTGRHEFVSSALTITSNNLTPTTAQERDIALLPIGASTITLAGSRPSYRILCANGTVQLTGSSGNPFGMGLLFEHAVTYQNDDGLDPGPIFSFVNQPIFNVTTTSAARTMSNHYGMYSNPSLLRAAGANLFTLTNLITVQSSVTAAAGTAITSRFGLQHSAASLSGGATVGTDIALDVGDLTGATTGISIRSVGTQTCRHQGAGVFGTTGAPLAGGLDLAKDYGVRDTSPAQITSNQNDYSPGTSSVLRLSTDASRNITGIASGYQGRRLTIINVGSFALVLQNQNASSSAANRIITGTAADVTLSADDTAELWYDSTTARWRITNTY